jgi:hypothetical protein
VDLRNKRARLAQGLAFGLLVAMLSGCEGDPRLEAQAERLALEQAERMEALDRIETRLLALRSRESQWNELRDRHGRVSAIACEQAAAHVAAMEAHDAKQAWKLRTQRRVAAAAVVEREERPAKSFRRVASEPAAVSN